MSARGIHSIRVRTPRRPPLAIAVGFLLCLFAVPIAGAQGVRVALTPSPLTVNPGAEFDLFLTVTEAGSAFNGFDAIVAYDPAALTLIQLSPLSQQEGTLMKNACANRFHRFRRGADRDTINSVLLCNNVSVTGPGQIYRLRYRASNTPQATYVRLLNGLRFFNAGVAIGNVVGTDAYIGIGMTVDVPRGATPATALDVRAAPNPIRHQTTITISGSLAGPAAVEIADLAGRVVRHLGVAGAGPGRASLDWDGRGDDGRPLPSGLYWVRARNGDSLAHTRIVIVR